MNAAGRYNVPYLSMSEQIEQAEEPTSQRKGTIFAVPAAAGGPA